MTTKQQIKYKYSRKQISYALDDLKNRLSKDEGNQSLVHSIRFNLLAKESKEEQSQRIMMEQVPKEKIKQMIPCTCPKGGMYSDNTVCDKCGGSEWIKTPTTKHLDKLVVPHQNCFWDSYEYEWAKEVTKILNSINKNR